MKLTAEQVNHIADLARLELSDEEKLAFQRQLSSILDYVDLLAKVDTEGIVPMDHSTPVRNVMRPDEARGCEESVRKRIIDSFPEKETGQLKVKAVFF